MKQATFCSGWMLSVLGIALSCLGHSQTRPSFQRSRPELRAPFLRQASEYDESSAGARLVMKNGMTVLVQETRRAPLVSLQAYLNLRPAAVPGEDSRLSDLTAALLCRGGGSAGSGTFRQKMHALGGIYECSADATHIKLEIVAAAAQWKQALQIQTDALRNPSFEQDVIQLESALLLERVNAIADAPASLARRALIQMGLRIPSDRGLESASKRERFDLDAEKMAAAYRTIFTPRGLTLVIAGDVRSNDVFNEAARLYGQLQGSLPQPRTNHSLTELKEFRYRTVYGDEPTPHLWLGFPAPSLNDADYAATEVLSAMLGCGEGALLRARLRDRKRILRRTAVHLEADAEKGRLLVELAADPENVGRAELAVFAEIALLKARPADSHELDRALVQLERIHYKRLETVSGWASALARFEFAGNWKRLYSYVTDLQKVKAADVMRAANRVLRIDRCLLLEYLPASLEKHEVTAESYRRALERLLPLAVAQTQWERRGEVSFASPPSAGNMRFEFSELQYPWKKASILRGPEMYIKEDHSSPLIDMGVYFRGGKRDENRNNSGITELMLRMILAGSADSSGNSLAGRVELLGGAIEPVVEDDFFGFHLTVPSSRFEAAFGFFSKGMKGTAFNETDLAWHKRQQLECASRRENSGEGVQNRIDAILFGTDGYALAALGNNASVNSITGYALKLWYEMVLSRRKPLVVAIGDTTGTALATYFVKDFSGSWMQEDAFNETFATPLDKGALLNLDWKRRRTLVYVGYQAPSEGDENHPVMEVLQSYLGGMGRLVQEMRDRQGVVSDIDIVYAPRLSGGSVTIRAVASRENADRVAAGIQEELARIQQRVPASYDLRAAQNSAMGRKRIRAQSRSERIRDLVRHFLTGKTMDDLLYYEDNLREVDEEAVIDLAKRVFQKDKAAIVTIRGAQE